MKIGHNLLGAKLALTRTIAPLDTDPNALTPSGGVKRQVRGSPPILADRGSTAEPDLAAKTKSSPEDVRDESGADRMRRTITPEAIRVELVSAFAGDREATEADGERIRAHKDGRGDLFFSDLIYAVSHHYFAPPIAEVLWDKILIHKNLIETCLGRKVGVIVASLDYLSNVTGELAELTLISEGHICDIATLAMRDGMTGLFNHSACHELLELELRNRRKYGLGVSVLFLDIDDFKAVNDLEGHRRGDEILVGVAKMLVAVARDSDICCRLGGDEFVIIMRLINDPNEAYALAERVRAHVERTIVNGHQIAVSIGVVVCEHDATSSHALIERADRALYGAKKRGKNQVVLEHRDSTMLYSVPSDPGGGHRGMRAAALSPRHRRGRADDHR